MLVLMRVGQGPLESKLAVNSSGQTAGLWENERTSHLGPGQTGRADAHERLMPRAVTDVLPDQERPRLAPRGDWERGAAGSRCSRRNCVMGAVGWHGCPGDRERSEKATEKASP